MEVPSTAGDTDPVEIADVPSGCTVEKADGARRQYFLILALFIASGFSSLIYQVVWTRLLALVFGSTTLAAATVLAVFMAGLALGSFLAGRLSDNIKRPFFCYGILEGLIGLWALVVPLLFATATQVYILAWQTFHLTSFPLSCLICVLAAFILIPPTSLMGATLPLLSKFIANNMQHLGRRVGTLYAANTLGAVFGAAFAGFVFLPLYGRQITTLLAAAVNFVLCALVLKLAMSIEKPAISVSANEPAKPSAMSAPVKWCIFAFAISGAIAMMYEVGWTRTLLLVIGSTTYAFTCMLTSFLFGIFLGGLICARVVDKAKDPLLWFAVLEFLVCAAGIISMQLFNYFPYWNLAVNARFALDSNALMALRFLLAAAILLPISLCLGAIFPVVVKSAVKELNAVGRSVGTLYSANTIGAICGALLGGFLLIPWLGTERMLIVASVANIGIGLALLYQVSSIRSEVKAALTIVGLIGIGWYLHAGQPWDRKTILMAQFERRVQGYDPSNFKETTFDQWRKRIHDSIEILFWNDGMSSLVGVVQFLNPHSRSLVTNGHMDGSDVTDMPSNILLAGFPLALKPEAQEVGIVGWGTGSIVGSALKFPVKSVTVIELEPSVVSTSKFFHHVNHAPESDPRVKVEINDGRNYLLSSKKSFDVLISEPSNPWQAGVCNLFTREYFEICKRRLKSGGIFSLWLQTHEIPPDNVKGILSSLRAVFPYNVGFMINSSNVCVLASEKPITADYAKLKKTFADKGVLSELSRADVNSAENLIARIGFTSASIDKLIQGANPNIDDTNKLEYAIGKSYENRSFNDENRRNFVAAMTPPWQVVSFDDLDKKEMAVVMAGVAKEALAVRRPPEAIVAWAKESMSCFPNAGALTALGVLRMEQGHVQEAELLWDKALGIEPNNIATVLTRAEEHLHRRNFELARQDYLKAYLIDPHSKTARYYLSQLTAMRPMVSGGPNDSGKLQAEMVLKYMGDLPEDEEFVAAHHDVLSLAALCSINAQQYERAETLLRRYLALEPHSERACRRLGNILLRQGKPAEAKKWLMKAEDIEDQIPSH